MHKPESVQIWRERRIRWGWGPRTRSIPWGVGGSEEEEQLLWNFLRKQDRGHSEGSGRGCAGRFLWRVLVFLAMMMQNHWIRQDRLDSAIVINNSQISFIKKLFSTRTLLQISGGFVLWSCPVLTRGLSSSWSPYYLSCSPSPPTPHHLPSRKKRAVEGLARILKRQPEVTHISPLWSAYTVSPTPEEPGRVVLWPSS